MPQGSKNKRPDVGASDAAGERWRVAALGAAVCLTMTRVLYPSENADASGDGVPVACMWLLLATAWLIVSRRHSVAAVAWRRPEWLLSAGGACIFAACLWGGGAGVSRTGLNMLWEWAALLVGFFLLRQLIRRPEEVRAIVATGVAVAVVLAGLGFYQSLVEKPASQAEYAKDPDAALQAAGVNAPADSPERALFERRLADRAPEASFALANSFAGFLIPWIVLAAAIAAPYLDPAARRDAGDAWYWKVPLILLIPLTVCLLLTSSRSGQAAAALGVATVVYISLPTAIRSQRRVKRLAVGVAAAGLLAGVVVAAVRPSVFASAARTLLFRLHYWRSSAGMIWDHPLLGCGPGRFQTAYARYKLPQASETVADPHNFLIEIAATAGLPAALLIGVGLTMLLVQIFRASKVRNEPQATGAARHVLVGACAAFLLAWFLSPLATVVMGPSFFLAGLFLAALICEAQAGWIQRGTLSTQALGVAAAALLLHLTVAGGIAYAGVAGPLWMLLPAACSSADFGQEEESPGRLPPVWTAAAAAVGVGLCYWFGFRPFVGSSAALKHAEESLRSGAVGESEGWLQIAAQADPLGSQAPRQLAAIGFERWRRQPNDENWQDFTARQTIAMRHDAWSAPAWRECGRRLLAGARVADREARLASAVKAFQRAVELHPAGALYRADLAWALHLAGDDDGAAREAAAALAIDAAHDHAEQKLAAARSLAPDAAAGEDLEQLMRRLSTD